MGQAIYVLVFLLLPLCSSAQLEGRVVSIADGDTFTILSSGDRQTKVRLYGVDAPERTQAFSAQSTQYLAALVFKKHVVVETKNRDRYGRVVGVARVGGVNINEALLRGGYVWHFKMFDRSPGWARIEETARLQKRGLWADPRPVAPWQWRKTARRVKIR